MVKSSDDQRGEIEARAKAYVQKVISSNVEAGMPPASEEEYSRAVRRAAEAALRIDPPGAHKA